MNHPSLEDDIRAALRHRADAAPRAARRSTPAAHPGRRPVARLVAAGVAAATVAAVLAVAVSDDRQDRQVVASAPEDPAAPPAATDGGPAPRDLPDAPVPRLGFDPAGFRFQRVEECGGSMPPSTVEVPDGRPQPPVFQTFGRSHHESPLLFLRTLEPRELANFGLLDATRGDAFDVRGVTGYAAAAHSAERGWNLSVELPDGRALYAIAVGLDLDAVTAVLDGLDPRADGGWEPATLPQSMRELEPSEVATDSGCYSAGGVLPAVTAGTFEVTLYNDAFDQRLADRAASTVGAIEPAEVDGVPAAIGSYADDDHWVMFEPEPGRSMEIRAGSMARGEVLDLLAHARFVDEATWQAMGPQG